MVNWFSQRRALVCALVLCSGFQARPAFAQGFLDQLEQKARAGLGLGEQSKGEPAKQAAGQDTPASGSAELPAPSSRRTPPPPPTPSASGSNLGATSSSILEPPALPLGNRNSRPAPATNAQQPAAEDDGTYLGLDAESMTGGGIGARVVNVTESSPAWRAGFKTNDVILAIDGFAISDLDTMVDRLSLRRPGETIKVLVLRGTKNVELTAVLQSASLALRLHGINPNTRTVSPLTPAGNAWLGVVVADLSSAFRTQFGLRAGRAAAVTNVTKGSPADALGIMPGDAIVGADGRAIESARDMLDWMATRRPGDLVTLNVMRGARATLMETTLMTDPKHQSPAVAKPVAPDPFASGSSSLNIESSDNTVPLPVGASDTAEVRQLRGELKAAQDQIQSLEQRLAELETLLKKK